MNRKVIVKQNGFKDCGPSCLLSIMKYYGVEASHEEVTYLLKTSNDGTNAFNIINGARSFGFDGYGLRVSFEEIVNGQISLPIICHVQKDNMYHFIVIYEIKDKYLIIMDPSSNIYKIEYDKFKSMYLGVSLVIFPINISKNVSDHKKLSSFIIDYLLEQKKIIIKVILSAILGIILSIFVNYYTLISIDYILPDFDLKVFIVVSILFMIVYISKNIFDFIKNKYLILIEKNISLRLNFDIIRKLFNLPYSFFKNKSTGEIMSRINDLDSFRDIVIDVFVNMIINILMIIVSSFILMFINPYLMLIYVIQLLLYFIIVISYKSCFDKKIDNLLCLNGNYNKVMEETINSYEIDRNINMLDNSICKINKSFFNSISGVCSYKKSLNNQLFIKDILISITYILSVILSIIFISNDIMSLGEFILFNTVIYYFSEPIKGIMDFIPSSIYVKNVYRRINDLIIMRCDEKIISEEEIKGDIIFDNVSYSHNGVNNIFERVSFKINYGSKFLIYGDSGYGKSSIMKILLKYLEDYKGNILIDGVDIKDIDSSVIQNSFTYVSQNSYLINDTLKNNILYDRNISEKDYSEIIKLCNLEKLIHSKPNRGEFIIEDNGFNISGGERQKIILARSLLKESNFIILDEALSEVDFFEEKEILNRIFEKYSDKTIIYISHKKEIVDMFYEKYKLERRNRS